MRSERTKRTTSSESTTLIATCSPLGTFALGGASVMVSVPRSGSTGDISLVDGRDRRLLGVRRYQSQIETQSVLFGQRDPFGVGWRNGEGVETATGDCVCCRRSGRRQGRILPGRNDLHILEEECLDVVQGHHEVDLVARAGEVSHSVGLID